MDEAMVPPDALPALRRYVDLLLRWNEALNLVGARDAARLWQRHIADSMQLAAVWRRRPDRAIDLGSGAGFPGLVLAIVTGVPFDLIEQDRGKAAFLREAARVTGAPVTVVAARIEQAAVAPAPLVTARALAPLARLLEYAEPLVLPDGECLFLKGRAVDKEIAEASRTWAMAVEALPSQSGDGAILRVSHFARR